MSSQCGSSNEDCSFNFGLHQCIYISIPALPISLSFFFFFKKTFPNKIRFWSLASFYEVVINYPPIKERKFIWSKRKGRVPQFWYGLSPLVLIWHSRHCFIWSKSRQPFWLITLSLWWFLLLQGKYSGMERQFYLFQKQFFLHIYLVN